jgi:hypothetical protein
MNVAPELRELPAVIKADRPRANNRDPKFWNYMPRSHQKVFNADNAEKGKFEVSVFPALRLLWPSRLAGVPIGSSV